MPKLDLALVIDHAEGPAVIDADYVRAANSRLTRSAALHPGQLRTALLVANTALLCSPHPQLLVVPVDEADTFNDLLATAYVSGRDDALKDLLRTDGFVDLPAADTQSQ